MSTAPTEINYTQFVGQSIKFVRNLPEPNEKGEGAVEVEGNVQLVNAGMLLIKPRGQVKFDMIPLNEIENVSLVESTAKKFKANKIKPVRLGDVRRHLLDRHGVQVSWANTVTEEQAKSYHDSLDHVALDLAHTHQTDEEVAEAERKKAETSEPAAQNVPDEY